MRSIVRNAEDAFRIQLQKLKTRRRCSNAELADLLGISERTISRAMNNPFEVSARVVLLAQEYLRREEAKAYGDD